MKKNIVRLTENQLKQIVNESVTRILREGFGEEELGVEESHVIPMDFVMRNHNSIIKDKKVKVKHLFAFYAVFFFHF